MKRMNTACMMVKPKENSIPTTISRPTAGVRSIPAMPETDVRKVVAHPRGEDVVRRLVGSDSGRRVTAMRSATMERTLANTQGSK